MIYDHGQHMDNMLQMRWGLLHGPEHGLHLYGDGFFIELRMWWDVLRNDWWWHEDVHSHGLSVAVGLVTSLVQTWGVPVYRDVLAFIGVSWQQFTRGWYMMRSTWYCCSGHIAWDVGASLPRWRAACGDCDRVVHDHGLRWLLIYDIPMGCMPWYGDLGDKWLPGWDIVEDENDFMWGRM